MNELKVEYTAQFKRDYRRARKLALSLVRTGTHADLDF